MSRSRGNATRSYQVISGDSRIAEGWPDAAAGRNASCDRCADGRCGNTPDGRRIKGTIHWVSAAHARTATARMYGTLFSEPDPTKVEGGADWKTYLNPQSLEVLDGCRIEPALAELPAGSVVQFERQGYFCVDPESTAERRVFNPETRHDSNSPHAA